MNKVPKPTEGVYPVYFQRYLDQVPDDNDLLKHLKFIQKETEQLVLSLSEDKLTNFRYAEGKWTIKEIMVHLMDAERIFAYRAMRFARLDKTPLPGFEENDYVPNSFANGRKTKDILKEWAALRASSIALIKGLDKKTLKRKGTMSGVEIPVAGLLNLIYGHHKHHLNIIRARYFD